MFYDQNGIMRPSNAYMSQQTNQHGSDKDLSSVRHQAVIWNNAVVLLIGPLGTNFDEILIETYTFSYRKMHLKCRLKKSGHFVSTSCAKIQGNDTESDADLNKSIKQCVICICTE